ncbi:MAG TPA: N-acetylmuramic acid 6-phosphate etherase [Candidatus Koribacter sp.]|jgi:N-acetylmuramic acid 6-phosphate etherase
MKHKAASDTANLRTERPNPASVDLDTKSALEIVQIINREDHKVAPAVKKALPQIAKAVSSVESAFRHGGRLIYVGTGTSGRLGALDSSECPPTFDIPPEQVQFLIAGGEHALGHAVEASEDSREVGRADMASKKPGKRDVVIGLAASGRTPYTVAAVEYARSKGAGTIAIVCNKGTPLAQAADIAIEVEVGPEVVSGSTRMKAGSAQKMICNMITTGALTRLGYVYGARMVNLHLKNEKLVERGIRMVQQITGLSLEESRVAIEGAGDSVPVALVMELAGVTKPAAIRRLKAAGGSVRKAIAARR